MNTLVSMRTLRFFGGMLCLSCLLNGCGPLAFWNGEHEKISAGGGQAPDPATVCSGTTINGVAGTAFCSTSSSLSPTSIGGGNDNNDAVTTQNNTAAISASWTSVVIDMGSDFIKANICTGKTIFGRLGTAVCNSVFGDLTASNAIRKDNATVDLMNSAARNARITASLSQEAQNSSTFTNNYNLVPDPAYDTDGRYDDYSAGGAKRNYLETIVERPTVVCGTSGIVAARVIDCTTANGPKAFYDGRKYGQVGEGDWSLVTFTGSYEVWRDERTQLIWSDSMSQGYNWFQAAGYSSSASTVAKTGYEGGAGMGTDCGIACQPAETFVAPLTGPISVCADAASLTGLNGVATYQNPDGTNGTADESDSKGSLSSVKWRLPTIEDWKLADVNGIRKVLPKMDQVFWSASSYSGYRFGAWYFVGDYGSMGGNDRNSNPSYSVRCVGR